MRDILLKADKTVQFMLKCITITLFIVLALILAVNVFFRVTNDMITYLSECGCDSAAAAIRSVIPLVSMHWFDEIVEMCFAALIFYGAAMLWGTRGHFCVGDWISPRIKNQTLRTFYHILVTSLNILFLAIFFRYSITLTTRATELTTVFQIHKSVLYSCMPVSSLIMLCYSVCDLGSELCELVGKGK